MLAMLLVVAERALQFHHLFFVFYFMIRTWFDLRPWLKPSPTTTATTTDDQDDQADHDDQDDHAFKEPEPETTTTTRHVWITAGVHHRTPASKTGQRDKVFHSDGNCRALHRSSVPLRECLHCAKHRELFNLCK